MTQKSEEETAAALEILTKEVRQLHKILEEVHLELYTYNDLNKMSLVGAIRYLIKYKRTFDEMKRILDRASRDPDQAMALLIKLEKLVEGSK